MLTSNPHPPPTPNSNTPNTPLPGSHPIPPLYHYTHTRDVTVIVVPLHRRYRLPYCEERCESFTEVYGTLPTTRWTPDCTTDLKERRKYCSSRATTWAVVKVRLLCHFE